MTLWEHDKKVYDLDEDPGWVPTNADGTPRANVKDWETLGDEGKKARIRSMVAWKKRAKEVKRKQRRAELQRAKRLRDKKKKAEKRLAEAASVDLEQPDTAVPATAAAASNAPVGAAAAAAIDAPPSIDREVLNSMAALHIRQGETNTTIAAGITELTSAQVEQRKTNEAFMSEQTKYNGNVTAILQNHDGRIDDLQKGQEANTTEIATLKDSHGEVSGRVDGLQSKQESFEERLKTIEKAERYNTAPIDSAGTRLSYDIDSMAAGDEFLLADQTATPVKLPAAKGGQTADVVPPSSMKIASTAKKHRAKEFASASAHTEAPSTVGRGNNDFDPQTLASLFRDIAVSGEAQFDTLDKVMLELKDVSDRTDECFELIWQHLERSRDES